MASTTNEMRIKLGFEADVSKAKQAMAELQSELKKVSTTSLLGKKQTDEVKQYSADIARLSSQLNDAFDVDTGKLNLNRLATEWKHSGDSAEKYLKILNQVPEVSEELKTSLVKALREGDTESVRLTKTLDKLWEQLKRTTKIQLSYTILNQLTGVFRNAVDYAQDLNKSLNNIQIVTGRSNDQMAKFAANANKAAKALNTTTTAYTDASLIYYQQGLNDQQVEERTEATIKLANVTNQSAEDVSSQMTAIWNNFADGRRELEYYADVITALGAATASSSAEIAQGLQQFAAVSNTVGLSYEYATAALATVVAQTRQSADSVGNSFKTIFARLESLNLGETLDDDTTLTKYTAALEKVGITVKMQNGQLKDMDSILDQLGSKWGELNEQQKNGLAYTVAGARQYTNFLALMDNWGKVQQNIGVASGAEGTLQEQQEIYAQSWEAASKRVQAALEGLYDSLINDKFFIGVTNTIAKIVEGVDKLIKSFGGLKGILPTLGSIFLTVFSKQIASSVVNFGGMLGDIGSKLNKGGEEIHRFAEAYNQATIEAMGDEAQSIAAIERRLQVLELLKNSQIGLTRAEENELETLKKQAVILEDIAARKESRAADYEEVKSKLESRHNIDQQIAANREKMAARDGAKKQIKSLQPDTEEYKKLNQIIIDGDKAAADNRALGYQKAKIQFTATEQEILKKIEEERLANEKKETDKQKQIEKTTKLAQEKEELIKKIKEDVKAGDDNAYEKDIELLQTKIDDLRDAERQLNNAEESAVENAEKRGKEVAGNLGAKIMPLVQSLSALAGAASSMDNLFDKIKEGTVSFSDLLSVAMSLGWFLKTDLAQTIASTTVSAINSLFNVKLALDTTTMGVTAIVTAVIALGVGLVKLLGKIAHNNYLKTLDGQIETLQKTTEDAAAAADEARSRYQGVIDTLDGLDSALDKIHALEKGTIEWTQAVADNNQQIINLLASYGKLNKDNYYIDNDGVYHLGNQNDPNSGEKLEHELKGIASSNYNRAMATSYASQAQLQELNNQKNFNTNKANTKERVTGMINFGDGSYQADVTDSVVKDLAKWMKENGKSTLEKDDILKAIQSGTTTKTFGLDASALADQIEVGSELTQSAEKLYNAQLAGTAAVEALREAQLQSLYSDEVTQAGYKQSLLSDEGFANFYNEQLKQKKSEVKVDENTVRDYMMDTYGIANPESIKKNSDGSYTVSAGGNSYDLSEDFLKTEAATKELDGHLIELIDLYKEQIDNDEDDSYGSEELDAKHKIKDSFENEGTTGETGKDIQKYSLDSEAIEESVKALRALIGEEKISEEMARAMVVANEKLNDGYADIIGNYKKYIKNLTEANQASTEYNKALEGLRKDIAEIADVDPSSLSESFVTDAETLKLVKAAAEGSLEAITELKERAAAQQISIDAEINDESLKADYDNLLAQIANSEQWNDLEIGATLDDEEFINGLNNLLNAGILTADQVSEALDAIGWEPEIEWVEADVKQLTASNYKGKVRLNSEDGSTEQEFENNAEITGQTSVYIPKINGSKTRWKGSTSKQVSPKNKANARSNGSKNKEADRYYTISRQVEKLNKQLDELGKKTDRAFGQAKLDAMQAEIDKYNDLIAANKEYLRQAEEWLAHDRAKMERYGATFDANGIITNYEAMFAAHGNDEDGEWAKTLAHYEDSLAKVQEMQEAIAEAQRAIYDKALEAIEYKLEFSIKINDAELKYLEYVLNGLEDAAYDSAEAIATLEKKIDNANKKAKALNENAVELFDIVSPGNGQAYYEQMLAGNLNLQALANEKVLNDPNFNASQWFDDINNLYEQLIENQENYRQMWKDYIDMMKNFWDSWKENFDKQKKQITDLTKVASFYKDLVGILGQDELGLSDATMARLDATVSKGRLDEALISYKTFLKAQKALQEAEEKDLDDEVIEYYKEKVQEAKDELMEAQKAAAQAFVDEYNNALDRIVKNAMDAFSNIGDFDWMKKMYDLELKRNDLYMDTYEKAYQMNKLGNDITRSINEIDGLKTKQELSSLLDEINTKQASGVKMSEYEYEAYRKEYELLLAIQALEDAKNAKNQVRMSRDNEGNMSYVYTADQDAIDAATDNYNDVAYQFAQLNMGQGANAEAQYLALYEQMMTEIREVGEEHRAEIEEKYAEMLKYWKDQAEISYEWNKALMDQTGLDYWDLTTKFEDSVLAHATGCQTWEELETHRKETTEQALRDMADADEAYHDKVHDLLEDTGLDVDNFEEQVNRDLDEVDEGMEDTMQETEDLANEFDEALGDMMDEAESFENKWDTTVRGIIDSNDALIRSLGNLIQQYNNLALAKSKATGTSYEGAVSSSVDKGNGNNTTTIQNSSTTSSTKTTKVGFVVTSKPGNGMAYLDNLYKSQKAYTEETVDEAAKKFIVDMYGPNALQWYSYRKYDTGGYTGEWGPEGRLAMLHQKELVLNADDTANMFQIIDAVRDITNALELQSHGANVDLSGTAAGAMAGFMNFDQNVHITAEFPNATDRNEIQAAFADLMNRATQYINRK